MEKQVGPEEKGRKGGRERIINMKKKKKEKQCLINATLVKEVT